MTALILKRAPIGSNQDDYDVLEDGVVVSRIFLSSGAPQDRPWMWGWKADSVDHRAVVAAPVAPRVPQAFLAKETSAVVLVTQLPRLIVVCRWPLMARDVRERRRRSRTY